MNLLLYRILKEQVVFISLYRSSLENVCTFQIFDSDGKVMRKVSRAVVGAEHLQQKKSANQFNFYIN